jgi:hypothetical protein
MRDYGEYRKFFGRKKEAMERGGEMVNLEKHESNLPRKESQRKMNRTLNRHRWVGAECTKA